MSKFYAIQDADGKFADDKSVRENVEGSWFYKSYDSFYAPCRLSASTEEAQKRIETIKKDLHKVKNMKDVIFVIKEVN